MKGHIIENIDEVIKGMDVFEIQIASGPSTKSKKWYKKLVLVVEPLSNEIYYEIYAAQKLVSKGDTIQEAIKNYNKW